MLIKEIPIQERPREKAIRFGIRSLSTRELLAILLHTGGKGKSALELADMILSKTHGLHGLCRLSYSQLLEIDDISSAKALVLQAVFELNRRMAYEEIQYTNVIKAPEALVRWLYQEIGQSLQEQFLVVYLDNQHRILQHKVLFVGTINATQVYPREIFKEALLINSTAMMLAHNHPSNELAPSDQDIMITRRLLNIASLMDIEILDHIIVGQSGYLSLVREGLMPSIEQDLK